MSQFDKDDVEAIGLVKFDFLGLATLTILELAKDFIVARHPERSDFAYETLPLDDPAVYRLFARGPHRGGVPVRIARHAGACCATPSRTASRT